MKLNIRISLVVLALTLSTNLWAQSNYLFKVLATSGQAEIKKTNSWQPLKSGASLYEVDEVRLGNNTYVGLIHTSGRSRELLKAGTYKIKDLAGNMGSGTSVMNKYFEFILSKNSDDARKNRLVAVGSVTRTSFKEDILLSLPENQHADILNNKVIINWVSKSDSLGPFVVTIQNLSDDVLQVIETKTTSISLDLSKPEFKDESFFLVSIKNKKKGQLASAQYLIKRLRKADQQQYSDQLTVLQRDMKEVTAINRIIAAGFYETNLLLIDAIVAYEEAIQMAPDVAYYKEVYDEFLLRNRLKFQK